MLPLYLQITIFLVVGLLFILAPLLLSWIIAPRRQKEHRSVYECGEKPFSQGRVQFKIQYYLIALLFIIFEVEVIYLIPWGVVLKKLGFQAIITMGIFLGILVLGLIYAIRKKVIEWN